MDHDINYSRVAEAIEYLTENFKTQPDLDEVARQVHLSPAHFQRIFTEWAGVSPKKFMQYLSLDHLRSRIFDTSNLHQAADLVGFSAQSRVYDLFVSIEGVTPNEYKTHGHGLDIQYGFHATPFGECFMAMTEKGLCALSFVDERTKKRLFKRFRRVGKGQNWFKMPKILRGCCNRFLTHGRPTKSTFGYKALISNSKYGKPC
jgi:AraC family transcriptional regulator, regulatory protein of adaptative response / methylated-DNA-[protein]-cysteine methyltransferase